MKNILGGIVAACIALVFVPLSIVVICILAAAAIVYQLATGQSASMVEYERTVERTDEDGRTTRRVFRSANGKTTITEDVVQ